MFILGMHFTADMGNSIEDSAVIERLDAQIAETPIDDINAIELEMGLRKSDEVVKITYANKDTFMFKALATYLKDETYVEKDGEKYLVYTNRYQMSELSKKLDSDDETMALCKQFDSMEQFRVKAA